MKRTKQIVLALLLTVFTVGFAAPEVQAQIPIIDAIKGAVKKVIKAIDLKIQRQQNKVIWLQNAQKVLENEMSKLKLDQITEWTQKQKDIYGKYFEELQKVKALISYYQRIREITDKQKQLVAQYNRAWNLLKNDKHFSVKEIEYMAQVYNGILGETIKNIDEIQLVVNSFKTQMTDAKRMEIINAAAERTERNYTDLVIFNRQNAVLSLQRAKTTAEIATVKTMYGIK
jgi:hypothetical protein